MESRQTKLKQSKFRLQKGHAIPFQPFVPMLEGNRSMTSNLEDPAEIVSIFGQRLNFIRKTKGLSLRELSIKAGIDNSKIAKIEKGQTDITMATQYKLINALDVTMFDFWAF